MKQLLFFFCLTLSVPLLSAQDWCTDLKISKKSPLPFGLEYGKAFAQQDVPAPWIFESAPENEFIFEKDSASFHVYTKSGSVDGVMMVVSCSSNQAAEKSFEKALAQFENKLGKSSPEMGKHLWEIKKEDSSYFISLQSLSPFQRNGWTLNVHIFPAGN
jgi:hypothetical protein